MHGFLRKGGFAWGEILPLLLSLFLVLILDVCKLRLRLRPPGKWVYFPCEPMLDNDDNNDPCNEQGFEESKEETEHETEEGCRREVGMLLRDAIVK
mgnify:FL=1